MSFSDLLEQEKVDELISSWIKEDTPSFDYGGFVVGSEVGQSVILCKSKGYLCGTPFVDSIFRKLNCTIKWHFKEGTKLEPICEVAQVHGAIKDMLQGHRVVLNLLARASGIASECRQMVAIKDKCKWKGEIAGTRKTTPGFRYVEKYALLVGGCSTHRFDTSTMVLLQDNHVLSVGSIQKAVKKARLVCGFSSKIEVECRSVGEALEACSAGAEVVMLDNFDASLTETAALQIKTKYPFAVVEVSGGITSKNIGKYMTSSIDVLSAGCLTQGYNAINFSMKILKDFNDPANPTVASKAFH